MRDAALMLGTPSRHRRSDVRAIAVSERRFRSFHLRLEFHAQACHCARASRVTLIAGISEADTVPAPASAWLNAGNMAGNSNSLISELSVVTRLGRDFQ